MDINLCDMSSQDVVCGSFKAMQHIFIEQKHNFCDFFCFFAHRSTDL